MKDWLEHLIRGRDGENKDNLLINKYMKKLKTSHSSREETTCLLELLDLKESQYCIGKMINFMDDIIH